MFIVASLFAIFFGSALVLAHMLWRWIARGGGLVFGRSISRAGQPLAWRLGAAAIALGAVACLVIAGDIAWLVLRA